MELLDIIVYSLKIFSATILTAVVVSYLIYKIKNRKREKPYLRELKNQSTPIKIVYPKPEINDTHFTRLDNFEKIPVEIIPSKENGLNFGRPHITRYIPEYDYRDITKSGIKNLNVLDFYSADNKEKMYKITR